MTNSVNAQLEMFDGGGRNAALSKALDALTLTRGNIASLGPAGALAECYTPYREWLLVVEDAIKTINNERMALWQ